MPFHCCYYHIFGILYSHFPLSLSPNFPPPSYHPHNCSVHSLQYEPNQTIGPSTSHILQTAQSGGTCRHSGMYKPPDRTEGEHQTVSVCVSVDPHHPEEPLIADKSNESGCPLRPLDMVWSLCFHSSSPLCQKSLCVINNTNEAVVNVYNLLVLCFIQVIVMGRRPKCDLSTEQNNNNNN